MGPNDFAVGIPNIDMFSAEQERADYCWAAIVQMILRSCGVVQSQQAIVQQIQGESESDGDHSATLGDIVRALNAWTFDSSGRRVQFQATPFASEPNEMIADLSNGWPMVVGMQRDTSPQGHVYLLAMVQYSIAPDSTILFRQVQMWDPDPGMGGWKIISGDQLKSEIKFAVRVRANHV